jgi:hypothetical protein
VSLRKKLREFAAEQIAQPGEHKKAEIASSFIDEHTDYIAEYTRELVERYIQGLIKELSDEPQGDPLPLFSGFPTAIAVAPGVVKATTNCNLDDLGAGLQYRSENVRHAQDRLDAYRNSMAAFVAMRTGEADTVGEVQDRLRKQGPLATT